MENKPCWVGYFEVATGGVLWVAIRGIERRKIFNDDKDRENLIERLSNLLPETKTQCYAWAFLSNHAHFLLRRGKDKLTTDPRRLTQTVEKEG